MAADLEQDEVSSRERLESLRVVAVDRCLQVRRRSRGDGAQFALIEELRETRLRGKGRVMYLEVDRVIHVADLVPHDHIGDACDREDRDQRQRQHQSQPEPERERGGVMR